MTTHLTIAIPAGEIDLTSPMEFFACHAAVLEVMGLKDAGPVPTRDAAAKVMAKIDRNVRVAAGAKAGRK